MLIVFLTRIVFLGLFFLLSFLASEAMIFLDLDSDKISLSLSL